MQYDNLPRELRESGMFCLWKYEERQGQEKPAKVPYQVNGRKAQPNNEKTFSDYTSALEEVTRYDGLGIGIFKSFSAIDIDHCINEDGTLSPLSKAIVDLFEGCYIEKSPSGKGLRILFKASGFKYNTAKYYINNIKNGVEAYVYGATKKFLSVTGNVFRDGDIIEAADKLQLLLDRFMLRTLKKKAISQKPTISYLSDEEVLSRAKTAKNSEEFVKLWNGEISEVKSHSEADLALCAHLAFWCGKDTTQMDRLFRQSGLYREKWDRVQSGTTYGQITLEKAVDGVSETYSPIGRLSQIETDFEVPGCKPLEELKPHRDPRYGWNDIGNSNLLADHYKAIARYVPERRQWFVYDGRKSSYVSSISSLSANGRPVGNEKSSSKMLRMCILSRPVHLMLTSICSTAKTGR
jgi:putative DNA primase/helicase